jgi:histidinol-phosphate/aromatic aminotransferase/cobyric acid decarboxylase-like protein
MSENQERQGGDLRDRRPVQLDLSTCVNPYGPPASVLEALRNMPGDTVRMHPYGAASEVETAYAEYLGQPPGEFVAGRGTSDLIWTLARHFDGKSAGLPLPAYTEFRQAFPHARRFGGGPSAHPLEVLDQAAQACDVVIMSNPHNPTGQVIPPGDLAGIAGRHPSCVLVVDESYIDFLADHQIMTLAGCDAGNVIVLRSPSKFFGLAGARSGVAWSLHPQHSQWRRGRTNWPVSVFAATALRTALAGSSWAARTRETLAGDARWLERLLAHSGLMITPGRLHFRLLTGSGPDIARFAGGMESSRIAVRVLEAASGVGGPAVRISAPRHQDRNRLASALGQPAAQD